MKEMPPEAGKKYMLRIRPNAECTCPRCGHILGSNEVNQKYNGMTVTVIAPVRPDEFLHCPTCDFCWECPEGWYDIGMIKDSSLYNQAVPYTWLDPIKEITPS